jgi:hypothetical protein
MAICRKAARKGNNCGKGMTTRASSFKNRSPKCPYLGAGAISQRGLKARFLHQHVGRGGQ